LKKRGTSRLLSGHRAAVRADVVAMIIMNDVSESKRRQPATSRQDDSAHYGIQMAPGFQ
jgi:flagellar basal body L-ring protein FlgH